MKKTPMAFLLVIVIIGATVYFITRGPSAQTRTWQSFDQISGAGTQDITELNMSDQWRVVWNIGKRTAPLFIIAVYSKTGTQYPQVAEDDQSDTNATEGILLMNSTGSFIIRVVAASDTEWNLRIEEHMLVKPT